MVVLAASICTKGGKAVISRQFRDMTRARIESLLASFPKLIPTGTQHTMVETSEVRFVYQPLEDLYIVLITNKSSNILQDIDTLHLFARVVSDLCRSAEEREILKNSFEVLGAFDEVVSLGYRENVNLAQVRSVLEMESHEEKIQEIIARNKEAEAKEELKRRAKQLEMQRRDQQRRAGGGGGGYGMGGGISGYAAVPQRFDTPEPAPIRSTSPAPSSIRAPAFKGSGMKLGSKKVKQDQLLDALGGEVRSATTSPAPGSTSSAKAEPASRKGLRGSLPAVDTQGVHLAIKEEVSATLGREGGLKSMELVGDMTLHISDASSTKVHIHLREASTDFGSDLALKQHPHINKQVVDEERVVKLKDLSRSFPVNQALAVLKWRYKGKDESLLPMSINCWPTPTAEGSCEVNIDYELDNSEVTLHDVVFSIPLPAGETPSVSSHSGEWSVDYATNTLKWSVGTVSSAESSGALEFSVASADAEAFYPVSASFVAATSLAGILVNSITHSETGAEVSFSQDPVLTTSEYQVA